MFFLQYISTLSVATTEDSKWLSLKNVVRIQPCSELCWFIDSSLKSMPGCNCILDYLMNNDTCFEFSMLGSLCAETIIVATSSKGGRRGVCIEIWLHPRVGCWGREGTGWSFNASFAVLIYTLLTWLPFQVDRRNVIMILSFVLLLSFT